ncbi:hypothetical protein GUK36_09245 [Rhizobium leguminosarum]|uniref:Uncharacterized protein n=1 Tax=Rhizobium leguminosarum TaxID=384 RepID=A0A6P0DDR9_RHILE|nr:hypothetical protein [Rhizobium leguminosarum]ASS56407.1 hypothetical protein CHR56_18605 [Rhizobium leguminosarum bv. viciae]NEK49611.1 hypothetical protein [Rhizobium leguminosarum]
MAEFLASLKELAAWPGSEFWAAIIGAVVGGLITLIAQRQEQKASRQERAEDRMLEAKGQAYSLLFKVISIHASFGHIKAHVDERLEVGKNEKNNHVSAILLPLANPPYPIDFAPSEMAMLLSLKDDEVFNALASLDKIHNSIIPVWTMYEAKRSTIAQQGENHTFDGSDGKGQFDVRRGSHLEAMMFEVEGVAKELVRRAQQDFAEANDALSKLVLLLNDRLQLGVNVTGK